MLKNQTVVAYFSFIFKFLNRYFTIKDILNGFVNAFFLSIFIFIGTFDNLLLEFLSPFLGIIGLYRLLKSNNGQFFFTGFFAGILWFYWISFSSITYNLPFLIPFEIIAIGVFYGVVFCAISLLKFKFIKAMCLIMLSYLHPFGFNWFNLEILFVNGIFRADILALLFIILSILFLQSDIKQINSKYVKFIISVLILIPALQFKNGDTTLPNLKIKLITTNIKQSQKWIESNTIKHIQSNFQEIQTAIDEKYDVVILPESAFELVLNKEHEILDILKKMSNKITIITGSLREDNGQFYNSNYMFYNGKISIFDKKFLVPFGEEIPLPQPISNFINKLLFDSRKDFSKSNHISTFFIKDYKFTNAICYEITKEEIYKNDSKFIIANSNNAWFTPSTQPVLQELLIKYFATKYNKVVFHSANSSKSKIIKPKQMWIDRAIKYILD